MTESSLPDLESHVLLTSPATSPPRYNIVSKRERVEAEEEENGATKRVKTEAVVVKNDEETADTDILTRPIAAPRIKSELPGAAEIQEDDLAVTVLGHSILHGIEGRKKHTIIFAKAYREFSYTKQIKRKRNINLQVWKEALEMDHTTCEHDRAR